MTAPLEPTGSRNQPSVAEPLASVEVAIAGRPYQVLIGPGLLPRAAELIGGRLGAARCAIITDANVATWHLEGLAADLAGRGLLAGSRILAAGEPSKSFAVLAELCESLLAMRLERGDLVLALGGGVTGDVGGLCARMP